MRAIVAPPAVPVGKIKSFGPFGPKYEVGQALRQLDDGDWMIKVTMVETPDQLRPSPDRLKAETASRDFRRAEARGMKYTLAESAAIAQIDAFAG